MIDNDYYFGDNSYGFMMNLEVHPCWNLDCRGIQLLIFSIFKHDENQTGADLPSDIGDFMIEDTLVIAQIVSGSFPAVSSS